MAKYGRIADENRLQFFPAVFSHTHTGQIRASFKSLIKEHICQTLICFEGQARESKIKPAMKWSSKCLSMVIAKTATRIVALKAAKMSDSVFAGQSAVLTLEVPGVGNSIDGAVLEDLGRKSGRYTGLSCRFNSATCSRLII